MSAIGAQPAALAYLQQRGIPFRVFRHAHPPASLMQAATERGQRMDQVVRSLVFRTEDGRFVLVLLPGGYRAHWPTLRRVLGARRLTLATPEEVLQVTGARVGTVSPWAWRHPPARILVDLRVLEHQEVSVGSGVPGLAVLLHPHDLLRSLPTYELGEFGYPQETAGGEV